MGGLAARIMLGALALLGGGFALGKGPVETAICGHILLITPKPIKMTDMERRLACGDDKNPPWADIPANQAKLFITSFLQGRGYYHPNFKVVDQRMVVETGDPTLVHQIAAIGAPPSLVVSRYWQPPGEPLTPGVLDGLEDWVRTELKGDGYPCPTVSSQANTDTGDVIVRMTPGPRQRIVSLIEEEVPGVHPGVMRRNDAFHLGDWFDNDLLGLTANRITSKDLLLSTHFLARCTPEGAVVTQKAIPGLPHQATAGVGYNTERGPLLRATFRNSRLDSTASSYTLDLQLSQRLQNFTAKSEWYILREPSRFYLEPLLQVQRADENTFEARSGKVRLAPAATMDAGDIGLSYALGPAFEVVRTTRGVGPDYSRIISLDGEAHLMTHAFEYYHPAPREGYQLGLATTFAMKALGSQLDFQRLVLDGQALWNIRDLAPPMVVLGVRGSLASTIIGNGPEHLNALPPSYRHYLGSSSNMRGFAREAVPTGEQGALTAAYLGLEARLAAGLPYGLQPLVFYDTGKTGRSSLQLDHPIYTSPGLGLRWQSPVGALRLTAARGIVQNASASERRGLERWVYYFSFGEEF